MEYNQKILLTLFVGVSIIIAIVVSGQLIEKNMMAKNIDTAIEKGIDPITVRCAYAPPTDNVCLAYSISHRPIDAPAAPANTQKR